MSTRVGLITIGRLLLLLAPWAFIAYLFRDVDAALDAFRDASVAPLVGALLLMLLALVGMALLWVRLVSYLGRGLGAPNAPHLLRSFARSWLARYLPGKVWAYGARALHTDANVVPRRVVGSSLVDEFVLIVGTATALGLGLWTWSLAGPVVGLPVLLAGLTGVVLAVSRLDSLTRVALRFLGRRVPRRWKQAGQELQQAGEDPGLGLRATALFTGGYLLNSSTGSLAFVLVVASLGDIGWDDVPLLIGAYNLAAVVGIVALFVPAGLGVREAVLAGFITPVVASPVAASVVVLIRALTILADVLFVGLVEATTAFSRAGGGGEGRPGAERTPDVAPKRSWESEFACAVAPTPNADGAFADPVDTRSMRLGTYYRSRLFRRLGLNSTSGRVLDIGGFDGYWAGLLQCESYVADVHPEPIYPGVRYLRADGMRLPFKDAVFDVVFAFDVIEHVPDEEPLIGEALRVLRPGGSLILTTPNVTIRVFPGVLQRWIDKQWGHDRVPGFSAEHLGHIFERHKLAHVQVRPLAISAFRWGYLFLSLLWRLPGPFGPWFATAAAAWDSRHPEGERGSVLVQVTR